MCIRDRDQGIGIAENKKKSIFVRFENLVDSNLFNPSTGIGLSLVKELVEMHKALITVDSKLDVYKRQVPYRSHRLIRISYSFYRE